MKHISIPRAIVVMIFISLVAAHNVILKYGYPFYDDIAGCIAMSIIGISLGDFVRKNRSNKHQLCK